MTAVLKPLPPREAIAALRRRGATLAPSFAWQDIWQDVHQSVFTVAKSTGFDILADIRDAVEDALADGSTLREFEGRLQPLLEARGWWGKQDVRDPVTGKIVTAQLGSSRRLQTIFETNLRTSYAQGQWARFEREKAERPWLRYVALMDGRTRPAHAARHNVCLPVDHPFWETWAPPCGWGCRCTLQSLSDRDVERLKADGVPLVFDPPPDRMVSYVNPRTGEKTDVPEGIDPGWAYNPGKISLAAANAIERTLTAPTGWTTAALEAMPQAARETAYRRWMTALLDGVQVDIGMQPVAKLADAVATAAGAAGDESWVVVRQGIVSHALRAAKRAADRTPDERVLLRLPQLLAEPIAILQSIDGGELIFLVGRTASHWERVVIKAGQVIPAKRAGAALPVFRASVATVDRVLLETYPNPGAYRLLSGGL